MLFWGLNTVALKVAGLVLFPFLLLRNQWPTPKAGQWHHLAGAILFGVVGHHSCLALGLEQTSATNAALILGLVPLTTALMAVVFLEERMISWLRGAGIFTGVFWGHLCCFAGKHRSGWTHRQRSVGVGSHGHPGRQLYLYQKSDRHHGRQTGNLPDVPDRFGRYLHHQSVYPSPWVGGSPGHPGLGMGDLLRLRIDHHRIGTFAL